MIESILILSIATQSIAEKGKSKAMITIRIECLENENCKYEGKDLPIKIQIYNHFPKEIAFPLKFLKKRGPVVKLTCLNTGKSVFLRSGITDPAWKKELTKVLPGGFVEFGWVLFRDEMEQFGREVSLAAEFNVETEFEVTPVVKKINSKN